MDCRCSFSCTALYLMHENSIIYFLITLLDYYGSWEKNDELEPKDVSFLTYFSLVTFFLLFLSYFSKLLESKYEGILFLAVRFLKRWNLPERFSVNYLLSTFKTLSDCTTRNEEIIKMAPKKYSFMKTAGYEESAGRSLADIFSTSLISFLFFFLHYKLE